MRYLIWATNLRQGEEGHVLSQLNRLGKSEVAAYTTQVNGIFLSLETERSVDPADIKQCIRAGAKDHGSCIIYRQIEP